MADDDERHLDWIDRDDEKEDASVDRDEPSGYRRDVRDPQAGRSTASRIPAPRDDDALVDRDDDPPWATASSAAVADPDEWAPTDPLPGATRSRESTASPDPSTPDERPRFPDEATLPYASAPDPRGPGTAGGTPASTFELEEPEFDATLDEPEDFGESDLSPEDLNAAAERELGTGGFFDDDPADDYVDPAPFRDQRTSDGGEPPRDAYPDGPELEEQPTGAAAPTAEHSQEPAPGRRWPLLPLIVGLLALALLVAGGYGVVKERAAMQATIYDLRARLAVAVTPEQVRDDRETVAAVTRQLATVRDELSSLRAERDQLATELAATESDLAEAVARAERAEEERAAAEAEVAAATRRAAAAGPAAATGSWFVNFGSYVARDDAARWAGRLAVDNGRVVIQDAVVEGRTLYRVRVLDLENRDSAENLARALERRHGVDRLWVGKAGSP